MRSVDKVLVGSPIRQKPEILTQFLISLRELSSNPSICIDYFFIDDNRQAESSEMLDRFAQNHTNTILRKINDDTPYICREDTHIWEENLIWKVAGFKNSMLEHALRNDYNYLFLVDSDLVLHPKTLEHLISLRKDIVAEIFWTKWEPAFPELPQVWVSDQYNLFESSRGENLTEVEMLQRVQSFLNQLKTPGIYLVGGLGACTLISKKAMQLGVNFDEIYNVSLIGEDRHFCIRAAALGFKLYVDTNYPAFHIYRLSDLDRLKDYKLRTCP